MDIIKGIGYVTVVILVLAVLSSFGGIIVITGFILGAIAVAATIIVGLISAVKEHLDN